MANKQKELVIYMKGNVSNIKLLREYGFKLELPVDGLPHSLKINLTKLTAVGASGGFQQRFVARKHLQSLLLLPSEAQMVYVQTLNLKHYVYNALS